MSNSVGDGIVVCALAAAFVGYWWIERRYRIRRREILHTERMSAMERGVPLFEVFDEEERERKRKDSATLPLIGIVFFALAVGAMIMMFFMLPPANKAMSVAPLPLAFMGFGLAWYHFAFERPRR